MNEVIIIAGPSWSWKDTLVNNLVKTWNYTKLVSDTTREKRIWEIEWKDYYFIDTNSFWSNLKEWLYFQYSNFVGNLYAYKKEELIQKIKKSSVLVISHPQVIMLITFFLDQLQIPYKTVYLNISKKSTFERMKKRWDSQESINKRKSEYSEFIWYKSKANIVINVNQSEENVLSDFYYQLFSLKYPVNSTVVSKNRKYKIIKITKVKVLLENIDTKEIKIEKDDKEVTWFFEYLLWKYRDE